MRKNEKGFGLVELILVGVIIILLGFVGYFYVQASHNQTKTATTATQSTKPTPSKSPEVSTAPKQSLSEDSVRSVVNNFYSAYFSALVGTEGAAGMNAAVTKYGSTSFVAYYNGIMRGVEPVVSDPVMCVQNSPMQAPAVTAVEIASGKATATVTEKFSGGSVTTLTATVTDENGFKVDSVTCPSR